MECSPSNRIAALREPTVNSPIEYGSGRISVRRDVLLVSNTGWYLYNFRRNLIRRLREEGMHVACVSPRDKHVAWLRAESVDWIEWDLPRSSMDPVSNLAALVSLWRIYRRESPDLVHHFTIKPILYGTIAARLAGIRQVVNNVTGLGHMFVSRRLTTRLIRPIIQRWYAWALTAGGALAIFQNKEDVAELAPACKPLPARLLLTNGSGVDLERFSPKKGAEDSNGNEKCVLFSARLVCEKGIGEFLEAGRICKERGLKVRLIVCGEPDPGNPSSVSDATLRKWKKERLAEFSGHVPRIEEQLRTADVVVLPSYREGTPRVLLEAAAMAKPIVATDVPGCREVVVHGETGLLVPPKDAVALADALERLLTDGSLRRHMGEAGRRRIESRFDERRVIVQTLHAYDQLSQAAASPLPGPKPTRLARGVFVFSLDLELSWGTRGRPSARWMAPFWEGTRDAIRELLELLDTYEISATWAAVGALLLTSRDSQRRHPWLAADEFADIPPGDAQSQPNWYADDILQWLLSRRTAQEIGCHSLTHRHVNSSAEGKAIFREELRQFRQLWAEHYLDPPKTFIFPKAKMAHFDVLAAEGFRCFRGPESGWFESLPSVLLPAAIRLVDAKLACRPKLGRPHLRPERIWMLPASQFYSPFFAVGRHVTVAARVRKAIKGITEAARSRTIFHLWTHPFNLGVRTSELLAGLEIIFQEASRLRDQGLLDVLAMGDLAGRLDRECLGVTPLESPSQPPEEQPVSVAAAG